MNLAGYANPLFFSDGLQVRRQCAQVFVRAYKFFFKVSALGHVRADSYCAGDLASRVARDSVAPRDNLLFFTARLNLVLYVRRRSSLLEHFVEGEPDHVSLLNGNESVEPVSSYDLFYSPACQFEQEIVAEGERAVRVEHHGCEFYVLKDFTQPALGFAQRLFDALALSYIQNEGRVNPFRLVERCQTYQNAGACAVCAYVLLLVSETSARRDSFFARLIVLTTIFRRGHLKPVDLSFQQLLARVADRFEKGIVGVHDLPVRLPENNADHVGLGNTPEPSLARCERRVGFLNPGEAAAYE